MRNALAVLLVLIGALLTFPGSAAIWEQRVLTNQDAFVGLGQEVLREPAVQDRIAARVTEDVITVAEANGYSFSNGLATTVARNQMESMTRAIVRDLPSSAIGERALITTHDTLLAVIENDRVRSNGDEIRVDFRPLVEQVLQTIENLLPSFPRLVLPEGVGEVVIVEEHDVAIAFRAARWFHGAAWYLAVLPAIAFAAALIVAANRQLVLFLIGLSAVIAAGLRIVIYEGPLRRIVIDNVVDDAALRPAARGIYDPIAASLVSQEMVLLAAGIFVIVVSIVWWAVKRTARF